MLKLPAGKAVADALPDASEEDPPDPALLLDDLYRAMLEYRNSKRYVELLEYLAQFRDYAPYNCFLVKMQRPSAGYVATPMDWQWRFSRSVKPDARAIVMLRPFGPVMFVYDLDDTTGKEAPADLLHPYTAEGYLPLAVWNYTTNNCEADGIRVDRRDASRSEAGHVRRLSDSPPTFQIVVNGQQSLGTAYATLVHEIAHVYCGHLGPHPHRIWPDRGSLSDKEKEFEAESVSFIVCARRGLTTNAETYLAGYLTGDTIPQIDIHRVMAVASRIEEMGDKLRKKKKEGQSQQGILFPRAKGARIGA